MTHRDTPGHGFYRLPSSLMELIPEEFRKNEYEEDLEWAIPVVALKDKCDFTGYLKSLHDNNNTFFKTVDDITSHACSTMRDYMPDEYKTLTGEQVSADNSYTIQEREWIADHVGQYLGFSAVSSSKHPGLVEVWVALCIGIDRGRYPKFDKTTEVQILVPDKEYASRGNTNWVLGSPERLGLYKKLLIELDLPPVTR